MITKKVSMKNARKSSFSNLVKYCIDEQNKLDRVETVTVTNCQSDNIEWSLKEIEAIQQQNTRSASDKTYHMIISFPVGESPSPEVLAAVEKEMCEALGFAEHQRISVIHNDTDNLHIHVAINKIHPTKLTLHEPYRDYKTRDKMCAALEKKYGLQVDNHKAKKTVSQAKASDMENHSGVESLIRYAQSQVPFLMPHCENWESFHNHLQGVGLKVKEKGAGLVFTTHDDVIGIKASSVGPEYSRKRLEEKFGPFAEQQLSNPISPSQRGQAGAQSQKQYSKQPVYKQKSDELYNQYKNYKTYVKTHRSSETNSLDEQRRKDIRALRRTAKSKRQILRVADNNALRVYTKDQIQKQLVLDINQINQKYIKARLGIQQKYKMDSWAKWIIRQAQEGNDAAKKKTARAKKKHELELQYEAAKEAFLKRRDTELANLQLLMSKEVDALQASANFKLKVLQLAGHSVLHRLAMRSIQKQLMDDIKKVNKTFIEKRHAVHHSNKFMTFQEWLRKEAAAKNTEAVSVLKGRVKKSADILHTGKTVISSPLPNRVSDKAIPGAKISHVTSSGTTVYNVAKTPIRDTGESITVNTNRITPHGLEAALRMAVYKYGKEIEFNAPAAVQRLAVQVAASKGLDLVFKNPQMALLHQAYLTKQSNQEIKKNEFRDIKQRLWNDGRRNSSIDGAAGPAGRTDDAGRIERQRIARSITGATGPVDANRARHNQSGITRTNANKPKNDAAKTAGMSAMSSRHLAAGPIGAAVLLPNHVRHFVATQEQKNTGGVRRDLHREGRGLTPVKAGVGTTPPDRRYYQPTTIDEIQPINPVASPEPSTKATLKPEHTDAKPKDAATVYIDSRNAMREKVFDIPYHRRYTEHDSGTHEFAGTRQIAGKHLALLKVGADTVVAPIDAKTAIRLNRIPLGTSVSIDPVGKIITASRGRTI